MSVLCKKRPSRRVSPKRRRVVPGQFPPRYIDFLMSLPFESVFGWSKVYRTGLCATIVKGDREQIKEYLQSAFIQHVGPLSITDEGAEWGANAEVFTHSRFQTLDVAVKVFNTDTSGQDSTINVQLRAMYEAVMGVIVHALLQHLSARVQAPKIYGFGYARLALQKQDVDYVDNNSISKCPVIVMSPLQGQHLGTLTETQLEMALYQTAFGLEELQKKFSFSHRDLQTANIRFDPETKIIEMFDFGESCFSWIHPTTFAFQIPITEMYDSTCDDCKTTHTCSNRSFDLAVLVASCLVNCPNLSDDGFIFNLAVEIVSFYQDLDGTIQDYRKFHEHYNNGEMAKCIPSAFIESWKKNQTAKKHKALKPLRFFKAKTNP